MHGGPRAHSNILEQASPSRAIGGASKNLPLFDTKREERKTTGPPTRLKHKKQQSRPFPRRCNAPRLSPSVVAPHPRRAEASALDCLWHVSCKLWRIRTGGATVLGAPYVPLSARPRQHNSKSHAVGFSNRQPLDHKGGALRAAPHCLSEQRPLAPVTTSTPTTSDWARRRARPG